MSSRMFRALLALALVAGVASWCACPVAAQQRSYDVRHTFNVTPGGNMRPWVGGVYMDFAFVNQTGWTNSASAFGWVRIPAAGFNRSYQAKVWPMPSEAEANSVFQVNPYGVGTPVFGSIRSHGFAKILGGPPPVAAQSSSTTSVIVVGRQRLRNGRILWWPAFTDTATGNATVATPGRAKDPIMLRVKDMETGEVFDETPVDINTTIVGDGSISWEEGVLNVNGLESESLTIEASVGSPSVEEEGSLFLWIVGGIIAYSYDDGIFEGVLPPMGMLGKFMSPIINPIALTYNLGDFNGHPLSVFIHLGGGGMQDFPPQYVDNIRDVRDLPDDVEVHMIEPKVVTVATGTFTDGRIYIEEPTRASGICARPGPSVTGPFSRGDRIEFWGYTRTDPFSGERYVDLAGIDSQTPGLAIGPVGMTNKTAVADETTGGIDVSGLLVTVWGKITYREPHGRYIYLDDGCGLQDGTLDDDGGLALPLIGLRVVLDEQTVPIAVPPGADYARVTGLRGMADGTVPCVVPVNPDVVSFFDIWPGGE